MKVLSRLEIVSKEQKLPLFIYQDKDGHYYGTTRKITQSGYKLLKSCIWNNSEEENADFENFFSDIFDNDNKHWFFISKPLGLPLNFDPNDYTIKVENGKVFFRDDWNDWQEERYVSPRREFCFIDETGKLKRLF